MLSRSGFGDWIIVFYETYRFLRGQQQYGSALFAPVQHPIFRGGDPQKASEFLNEM